MLTHHSFAALVSHPSVQNGLSIVRPFASFAFAAWNWLPLTPLGLAVLGFTVTGAYLFGGQTNDRIVLVGSVVSVSLVAVCTTVTLLTALWLRFRPTKSLADLKLAVNQPQPTGFQLGWLGFNPILKVELAWENLPDSRVTIRRQSTQLNEEVTPGARGEWLSIRRRFIVADVFGLSRCIFVRTSAARIRVEPDRHRSVPQLIAEQAISGDQHAAPDGKPLGDLLELRRYVAGDPLKRVLWKTYARTGQLLVRSEEKTRAATKKTLAYFVTEAGDESTAAVARGMLETGSLGNNFTIGADRCHELASSVPGALELLIQAKTQGADSRTRLPEFLTRGAREGANSCVVFVPSQAGAWLQEVSQALAQFPGKSYVVVAGNPAAGTAAKKSHWTNWLVASPQSPGRLDNAAEIRNQLTNKSTEVIIVG